MSATAASTKREQAQAASAALAALPGVEAVCVFGSVARGRPAEGSDIDLLVLGSDEELTPSALRRRLPRDLDDLPISLAYHTEDSLDRYLHRWSRFGAHLRREALILHDAHGALSRALAADIPVSTRAELTAQRRHLANYQHPERFGGRFLFALAHLYRIGRTVVFAILAEHGTLEFDRGRGFAVLRDLHPDRADDIAVVERLAPFYERVSRRDADTRLPFEPLSCEDEVVRARDAIGRLAALSHHDP